MGYQKFNRRAEDWAMVAVGVTVKKSGDTCEDVRVGLTNMSSVPLRATTVEASVLSGEPPRLAHFGIADDEEAIRNEARAVV